MTNLEVAKAMVQNALAYGKSGDMDTVLHNLRYIELLLNNPQQANPQYKEEDFK